MGMNGQSLRMKRLSVFPRSSPCTVFSSSFRTLNDSKTVFKYGKGFCKKKRSNLFPMALVIEEE